MDDPWGSSPWADEVQSNPSSNTFVKVDIPIRPTSPIIEAEDSSSHISQQTGNSPWVNNGVESDYNGFGEWADAPAEAGVGLDGAVDIWGVDVRSTANNKLVQPIIRAEAGFEVAWDDAPLAEEEPKTPIAPNLPLDVAEVPRQLSPDPWGFGQLSVVEDTSDKIEKVLELEVESGPPIIELDEKVNASAEREATQSTPELTDNLSDITETVESDLVSDTTSKLTASKTDSAGGQDNHHLSDGVANFAGLPNTQDAAPTSSRPSSSPSDGSHRDASFVESPRTSLDDEPKRAQMLRQTSKVHQLVEHFDTLAKREVTPGPEDDRIGTREESTHSSNDSRGDVNIRPKSAQDEEVSADSQAEELDLDDDDFGDFGDFEEGNSDEDEALAARVAPVTSTISQPIISNSITEEARDSTFGDRIPSSHEPVEFNLDLTLLDEIYVGLSEDTAPEQVFVPDVIPHDSFTRTEERKMWYRLSRYGPMRQHESGDDDNYVRINWMKSQVRNETLEVVARWIEEDRISGRVVLGGGSKAGSIFGWNESESRPASVAAAFAERNPRKKQHSMSSLPSSEIPREWPKGLVRERSVSKGRSTSKPRRRSSVKPVKVVDDLNSGIVSAVPAAVDFGWGSGTASDNQQETTNRSQSSHKASNSSASTKSTQKTMSPVPSHPPISRPMSLKAASKPKSIVASSALAESRLGTVVSPSLTDSMLPPTTQSKVVFDADDDWGEMISSPVVAAAPTLPVQKTLRHKRSQSFGNNISTNKPLPPSRISLDQILQTTLSNFDQILIPTPATLNTAEYSGDLHFMADPGSSSLKPNPNSEPFPSNNIAVPAPQLADTDAWASADFSFFESAPTSAPAPVSKKKGILKLAPAPMAQSANLNPVISPSSKPHQKGAKEDTEQDKIVKDILRSLPDLSYMLKR
jgi:hypothetical protein